ncbi:class I SAM-dependent methyltransferase [Nocardiopsis listeri]|uniref:class I SAM-dependent methyltransferase n=1 Tax=Nocardiopsis listeri TaxID=53440 RepID=UPI001681785F|nr:class I SAM-dependent methyltransferase [Nocardiopsis listeri]
MLTVHDVAKYFAPEEGWNRVERLACERVQGRVLDVGCGPGRHAVHLMNQGVEVVGVEPSAGAAAVARERGVEVVEAGVENLDRIRYQFGTILLGGQNLGLLGSRERASAALSALAGAALPGGVLLGVGIDPGMLTSSEHTAYAAGNRAVGRLPGQQRFRIRDGSLATDWFDYLLASPTELAEIVEGGDWELVDVTTDGPRYLACLAHKG